MCVIFSQKSAEMLKDVYRIEFAALKISRSSDLKYHISKLLTVPPISRSFGVNLNKIAYG